MFGYGSLVIEHATRDRPVHRSEGDVGAGEERGDVDGAPDTPDTPYAPDAADAVDDASGASAVCTAYHRYQPSLRPLARGTRLSLLSGKSRFFHTKK